MKVLLTGATGYVGGRLLRAFEEADQAVRCLARRPREVVATRRTTEVVPGDCLDEVSLEGSFAGVETAYYLVHSMGAGRQFAERDRRAAANFGRAAARAGVRRIVYLGGLADDASSLSAHLKSRAETGDALRASGVPVVEFRASIIVGGGSLSFEIVRALVERLPVMICPRWVETLAQPIAIDDVIAYLRAALQAPGADGRVFEIGGPEVVSYGDLMRRYARLRGLRRLLVPVPVLSPRLSGMWLTLVTPAQSQVGRALVEGLRNASVVRSYAARQTFATIEPMPLDAALTAAMNDPSGTHWKVDTRTVAVDATPARAFAPIRRIGGSTGWYYGSPLWKTRARIDRWIGGIGMDGRRRDPEQCTVGDVIDGWTVDAYEPDGHMRLLAGMKLPGRGWLEFEVTPLDGGRRAQIRQTARFDPKGVLGRAYWYAVLPFHAVIFRGLLRRIAQLAERGEDAARPGLFVYRSVVAAPAGTVFRWHERSDALQELMPPGRLVRVQHRAGGLRDGGRVTLTVGLGPLRFPLEFRHYGYVRGQQFCDEQVRGPFRIWRHTHRVQAIATSASLYEDRVEYGLRGGVLANLLFDRPLRLILARVFARRHRTVQARLSRRPAFAGARNPGPRAPMARRAHRIAGFVLLTLALAGPPQAMSGQALPPVRTVESVDLRRYGGDWYEVARFPNRFQRHCVSDVRATYAVRPDGRLDVFNRCRTAGGAIDAKGIARVVDARTSAKLKVRFAPTALSFLPFVWGDYWILGLGADYSWSVVGSPDRNYLWILSRTPDLPSPAFTAAVDIAVANGFDAGRLVGTPVLGCPAMRPPTLRIAALALVLFHTAPVAAQDGAALYARDCAACHDMGVDRAPSREALRNMTAERVLAAMESGAMISMASRVNGAERRAIAQYITGKTLSARDQVNTPTSADMCSPRGDFTNPLTGNNWNGWGNNTNNTRFQPAPAASLTAAQLPRLKVKWAFGFPGDLDANAQPSVVGGRVFVGSQGGVVYSLSAESGCVHWFYKAQGAVRGAVTVAPVTTAAGQTYAAFFGDLTGNVHAVNAATGALLWTARADPHPVARIVGSVVFHDGHLYVPVASAEETAGAASTYQCCTFRGSIVAYDAASGRQIWKTFTISDEPKPTMKNAIGTQLYGPSGAGVWSSPAVDTVRNVLYITTGDNYSAPATATSDSFMALDLETGKVLWTRQMTAGDAWNTACRLADKANCPDEKAPDFDFSSPPILVALANGKRALVSGQKSGMLHAVDPDDDGAILWQARLGVGGTLGGVQWGSASDGTNVYVALSDIVRMPIANSLGSNADPKTGGGMFAFNLQTGQRAWYTPPAPCGARPRCSPAQSAAVTAIPGVVFSGSVDGHLRGYSTTDGRVIFDFDSVGRFKTVNEVQARGGSFDGPGPAIAGGMMFVSSGYARAGGQPGNVLLAFSVDGK